MRPYVPLPKGSVRLLRLLPPSEKDSSIECQLFIYPLLDSEGTHPYDALSYVWGPPEDNQPSIDVDGSVLSVRTNLHAALLHLRDHFVDRILWIDAICINQADEDEKSHQVQEMAKIYSKASRVIVWLGDAAKNGDLALEAIRAVAEEQSKNHSMDESIVSLLERDWFRRIWASDTTDHKNKRN